MLLIYFQEAVSEGCLVQQNRFLLSYYSDTYGEKTPSILDNSNLGELCYI